MSKKRVQTKSEELLNATSHGLMAISAVGGLVILVSMGIKSPKDWSLFSALVYGGSLVALYTFSTLYHGIRYGRSKQVLKILDHCGIFILIAGTYTPVLLLTIRGQVGWVFFAVQWGMALTGIILKIFYTGKYKAVSTLIYAVMGWIIVLKIDLLKSVLPDSAYTLLLAGGFSYTIGIVFYLVDSRFKYAHFIWHLFVMAGSIFHYLMMVRYIFP